MKNFSKYYVNKLFSNVLFVSCTSPNSFHDFIFTIRKKNLFDTKSRKIFPKNKKVWFFPIRLIHFKANITVINFVWKYYRVIKKKKNVSFGSEIGNSTCVINHKIKRNFLLSNSQQEIFIFIFLIGSKKDLVWL